MAGDSENPDRLPLQGFVPGRAQHLVPEYFILDSTWLETQRTDRLPL